MLGVSGRRWLVSGRLRRDSRALEWQVTVQMCGEMASVRVMRRSGRAGSVGVLETAQVLRVFWMRVVDCASPVGVRAQLLWACRGRRRAVRLRARL
ncbi:hypothetical protein GCM10009742_66860 [Kribbella karoonensis]|uniref:Uncharacterized protein n=1 Tax=Kribbella karoonensis TaxID=324851 RepID=A0ABN2EHB0_9ACTN